MENIKKIGSNALKIDLQKCEVNCHMKKVNYLREKIKEEKEECNHEIVLNLGCDGLSALVGDAVVYVCPICGKKHYQYDSDVCSIDRENPFSESKVLDFSNNRSATARRNENYELECRVREALIFAYSSNKEMTIDEFVSSIPKEWYTTTNFSKTRIKRVR